MAVRGVTAPRRSKRILNRCPRPTLLHLRRPWVRCRQHWLSHHRLAALVATEESAPERRKSALIDRGPRLRGGMRDRLQLVLETFYKSSVRVSPACSSRNTERDLYVNPAPTSSPSRH